MAVDDTMVIMPLGGGQEVGRSCILLQFRGRNVMLDCGAHPGREGNDSLPFFDSLDDPSEIDLVLITHFHIDHCAALPYFTEKTNFRGKIFMTHATKAVMKMLLSDNIKLQTRSRPLYRCAFGPPGNASNMCGSTYIQAHQPPCIGALAVPVPVPSPSSPPSPRPLSLTNTSLFPPPCLCSEAELQCCVDKIEVRAPLDQFHATVGSYVTLLYSPRPCPPCPLFPQWLR